MRPPLGVSAGRGSIVDPAVEKYLLDLHAALDLSSFWTATQQLLAAMIPNQVIGLTLRHDPVLPLIENWTSPMPAGFFAVLPFKEFIAANQRKKFLRVVDLFANRRAFIRSTMYRRYLAPQKCAGAVCLLFWEKRQLICAIVILRSATQKNFSTLEMKVLRTLYARFAIALQRLRALEPERAVRTDLEEFVRRLPLPTILLRWNLQLLFQNPAARDFCAVWQVGAEQARLIKSSTMIPAEILRGCRKLKQRWRRAKQNGIANRNFATTQIRHPRSPHLRATIRTKQLNDAVAQPHFLVECEDLRRLQDRQSPELDSRLSQLVRLTGREQQIAQLVCTGQSNKEIAEVARVSLPTVKKHLHGVFRKLEVSSRVQLMRLML